MGIFIFFQCVCTLLYVRCVLPKKNTVYQLFLELHNFILIVDPLVRVDLTRGVGIGLLTVFIIKKKNHKNKTQHFYRKHGLNCDFPAGCKSTWGLSVVRDRQCSRWVTRMGCIVRAA